VSVSWRIVQAGRQKITTVCMRSLEVDPQKLASFLGVVSRVAAKNYRQSAGEEWRVAPKNCLSFLEKYSRHQKKCRQSAGDVSREVPKNVRQCRRDVSRVAAKKVVSVQAKFRGLHTKCVTVLEKCPGCQPKTGNSVLANFREWLRKSASVSSRIFQGGSQKWRRCAGELRRVRRKEGESVLQKCRKVPAKKWTLWAGKLLCVVSKNLRQCLPEY
jgi:hypothetical protein